MAATEEISLRICDMFTTELSAYFKAIHARAVNATRASRHLELQQTQRLLDIRERVRADAADVLSACVGPGSANDTLERELAALKHAYEEACPGKAHAMSFRMQDILGQWMLEAARELYLRVEIFHKNNRRNLNPNLRAILVTAFFNVFSAAFRTGPTSDSYPGTDSEYEEHPHDADESESHSVGIVGSSDGEEPLSGNDSDPPHTDDVERHDSAQHSTTVSSDEASDLEVSSTYSSEAGDQADRDGATPGP